MSLSRLVWRSLAYYWRALALAVFGFAAAASVLTGSLVIGDSVHGSLRDTSLSRLGRVEHALSVPVAFRAELAKETAQAAGSQAQVAAALVVPGSVRNPATDEVVADVTVWGLDEGAAGLLGATFPALKPEHCALNAALARDLGISGAADLLLTVRKDGGAPGDSLFARRDLADTAPVLNVTSDAVLPDRGPGDLRLDPQSATPRNVFVPREWLAAALDKQGLANTLLAAGDLKVMDDAVARSATLADRGLQLDDGPAGGFSVKARDVVLSAAAVKAAGAAAGQTGAQALPASVYLLTRIARADGSRSVAYALSAALDGGYQLPLTAGRLPRDGAPEMVLNDWALADLGAPVGETLRVSYLVPRPDGSYTEASTPLRLVGATRMAGLAAARELAPTFEGITGARRIGDWNPPFPLDYSRITPRDETYWERYRATPRAFVTPALARRMWSSGSPAGAGDWVTSVVVTPRPGADRGDFERALLAALPAREVGLAFRPVRAQALAAARGNSDFGQLFLGLGMFIVAAGAGLAVSVLRLSLERRTWQSGLLSACGVPVKRIRRLIVAEALAVSVAGVALGTPLGLGYAAAVVAALGRWWHGALGDAPGLSLHVQPGSLAIGAACGLALGLWAALAVARGVGRRTPLQMLSGTGPAGAPAHQPRPWLSVAALALAVVGLLLVGLGLAGKLAPAGAFFGAGTCVLVAGIMGLRWALGASLRVPAWRSVSALALREAGSAPGRSLLTAGLLAASGLVLVTVAANTRDFGHADLRARDSGAGGFDLMMTSSVPLPSDPGSPAGRERLGFQPEDEAVMAGCEMLGFLASPGEDISCLNLARPSAPRVLGVPDALVDRGGFRVQTARPGGADPWRLLLGSEKTVPAFGDADSVQWTLHSGLGKTIAVPDEAGAPRELRFAGLLKSSIFARELLVSRQAFSSLYPSVRQPSVFLVRTPEGRQEEVARVLRANLGDAGVRVRTTREVLNGFLRVQNTYLSMFLALGGLGLILGTIGLAAMILRGVHERRAELAYLEAAGFSRRRVRAVLLIEHAGLMILGLVLGTGAALLAVLPQLSADIAATRWSSLGLVLGALLISGLLTTWLAVGSALRGTTLAALRSE